MRSNAANAGRRRAAARLSTARHHRHGVDTSSKTMDALCARACSELESGRGGDVCQDGGWGTQRGRSAGHSAGAAQRTGRARHAPESVRRQFNRTQGGREGNVPGTGLPNVSSSAIGGEGGSRVDKEHCASACARLSSTTRPATSARACACGHARVCVLGAGCASASRRSSALVGSRERAHICTSPSQGSSCPVARTLEKYTSLSSNKHGW